MIMQLQKLLEDVPNKPRKFICIAQDIIEVCNEEFNCDLRLKRRNHPYVFARHFCCYFLKEHTKLTLTEIAYHVGNGDHSSVINSIKQTESLIATDEYYADKFNKIKNILEVKKIW